MFGPLGVPELLFILALALLIFGPRKLPEIGRTLGKSMAEFRKASNELKRTLNTELIQEELRESDPRRALKDAMKKPVQPAAAEPAAASEDAEPAAVEGEGEEEAAGPKATVARGQLDEPAPEGDEEPAEAASALASDPESRT